MFPFRSAAGPSHTNCQFQDPSKPDFLVHHHLIIDPLFTAPACKPCVIKLSKTTSSLLFFITLEPRVERCKSLWTLNTSPPRSRFTFLRSSCSRIETEHWLQRHPEAGSSNTRASAPPPSLLLSHTMYQNDQKVLESRLLHKTVNLYF